MKVLVGCDIIEVNRIQEAMKDEGFLKRVFTQNEISYCETKKDPIKYQHYAARFAAKEAIFKALSPNLKDKFSISWKNVEITNDENQRPLVTLIDTDAKLINQNKISIDVSISHVKELALATSVITIEGEN